MIGVGVENGSCGEKNMFYRYAYRIFLEMGEIINLVLVYKLIVYYFYYGIKVMCKKFLRIIKKFFKYIFFRNG